MNGKLIFKMLPTIILFIGIIGTGMAKDNILEKNITLSEFLNDISERHDVFFTYNPTVLSGALLDPM